MKSSLRLKTVLIQVVTRPPGLSLFSSSSHFSRHFASCTVTSPRSRITSPFLMRAYSSSTTNNNDNPNNNDNEGGPAVVTSTEEVVVEVEDDVVDDEGGEGPKVKAVSAYDEEDFLPLDIIQSKARKWERRKKTLYKSTAGPPRYLKMPVDQDWGNVWPVARTFHPATVPLPLHQGYTKSHIAAPNKWANLELMKIANFLHLTPPVVRRQCEALKKFCTPWPEELKDPEVVDALYPIEITTNDYCHSLPTIRDFRARIVTLQIKLSSLDLDAHAKDKLCRLIGKRYNPKTDLITLTVENCPLRKQNYDYAMYLLTALYHESWNKEPWEDQKSEEDMEQYIWDGSISQKRVAQILSLEHQDGQPFPSTPTIDKYRDATTHLHNDGEDLSSIHEYGKGVREMLNLPQSL